VEVGFTGLPGRRGATVDRRSARDRRHRLDTAGLRVGAQPAACVDAASAISVDCALIPLAVLVGMWRYRVARAAVRNLMIEIGTSPLGDGVIDALRAALRDPDLALWSFSRARDGYVDAQGRPQVLPPRNDPREATALIRDGVLVGALVYDRAVADQPRLLAAVRAATTLALDNQRLHGELEAQMAEVRRAREQTAKYQGSPTRRC